MNMHRLYRLHGLLVCVALTCWEAFFSIIFKKKWIMWILSTLLS